MGRAGSKRNSFFVFPPYTIPPNFVQIGAIFLELSCPQTDRQTHRHTDTQTDPHENITSLPSAIAGAEVMIVINLNAFLQAP